MKRLNIFFLNILLICAFACSPSDISKDSVYLNGDIRYIVNDSIIVKYVTSKVVMAGNYGDGQFAVYDSIAIFWNPKFQGHFFGIFNIDTGKEIGYFCRKGKGPGEASSLPPVLQFFRRKSDLMTLLHAANNRQLFFWNITQSIKTGLTVYDTIVPYDSKPEGSRYSSRFGISMFYQNEDKLIVSVDPVSLSKYEATVPYYEQRTIYSNELVRDYRMYKIESIHNNISGDLPVSFFYTVDAIKPDGSKIVQAMRNLPQINILDIRTGEVVGSRVRKRPDFSLFETDMKNRATFYISVQADDKYIYVTSVYVGNRNNENGIKNTIHVFDWSGTFICELRPDRVFHNISLDPVRNRLYSTDYDTEEIFYLDLNEFLRTECYTTDSHFQSN